MRHGVTAMRQLLIAVRLGAADCMADDRAKNKMKNSADKRVLVRGQHPAAAAYRPRAPGRSAAPRGSSSCGAGSSMGFDSEDPRWKRKAVSTTYMPIWRNSLSQFSKVASQKSPLSR